MEKLNDFLSSFRKEYVRIGLKKTNNYIKNIDFSYVIDLNDSNTINHYLNDNRPYFLIVSIDDSISKEDIISIEKMSKNKIIVVIEKIFPEVTVFNNSKLISEISKKITLQLSDKIYSNEQIFIDNKFIEKIKKRALDRLSVCVLNGDEKTLERYEISKNTNFNNFFPSKKKDTIHIVGNGVISVFGHIFKDKNVYRNFDLCNYRGKNYDFYTLLPRDKYIMYNTKNIPKYDLVICLSGVHNNSFYHFLYDHIMRLYILYMNDINWENTYIHLSEKSEYMLQICELFGIKKNNIITGPISFNTLIVPGIHEYLSFSECSINFLKYNLLKNIKIGNKRDKVVLCERTFSRKIEKENFIKIKNILHEFCKINDKQLIVHNDSNLPDINEQIKYFSEATHVLSSAGSSLIFICCCSPGTTVIEFMNHPSGLLDEFIKISYFFDLVYYALNTTDNKVDLDDLSKILYKN